MRIRRAPSLLRLLAALVTLALVAGACGGSGDTSEPSLPTIQLEATSAVLAASVDRTVDLGSYNFDMIAEVGVPGFGINVKLRADGSVDVRTGSAAINVDMSDMFESFGEEPGVDMAMDMLGGGLISMIVTPDAAYMNIDGFGSVMGIDTDWVKVPIGAGMLPTDSFGLGDPTQMLGDLTAAGEVTEIGPDTVRGVPVTHYQVLLDPMLFEQFGVGDMISADLPVDVYIDASGLIRRIQGNFSVDGATGGVAMELYDFGAGDPIEVPSGGDVTELDPAAMFGF